jgi:large subunit ribosomal protein L25
MEAILKAEVRNETGSKVSRALRSEGKIPAVVYGKGQDVQSLVLDGKEVKDYFANIAKEKVELEIAGKKQNVTFGEIQRHPISRDVLHIDFIIG